MHKRGIALLITLVMLGVLSALVMVGLHTYEAFAKDYRHLRTVAQVQRSLMDTKTILDNTLADVNTTEIFELLFFQPIVVDQEGSEMRYTFWPIDHTINVNRLTQKSYRDFFERVLLELGLMDPMFLISLVLDTIDTDHDERMNRSERILEESTFRNGKVYTWEQFKALLDVYADARDDARVYEIAWERYISVDADSIDIHFASLELLKFLLPTLSIDRSFKERYYYSLDELEIDAVQKQALKDIGVKTTTHRVGVRMVYDDGIAGGGATFIYDLQTKKKSQLKYFFK